MNLINKIFHHLIFNINNNNNKYKIKIIKNHTNNKIKITKILVNIAKIYTWIVQKYNCLKNR